MNTEVLPDGTFILDTPVELPDVLDVVIVGGGPAGTAAAFRAKELGLSALVIDYDDLMKRIRDYAKSKLILPDYGGGDKMQFPQGGDLISALHFEPIDKDDMCNEWKGFYRTFNVPAKIGLELTGFEYLEDGTIQVNTFNHRLRKDEPIKTKHLVYAIGRGVPRRFDIPGNTDGIAYRLDDAENYTGRPVCIIGGGTSAAEAVIAISNSKIDSKDSCPVYWSYRGDKMPKVSKALSQVFFDAYVGNGNIRYYPKSEPVAIITGPDREEYLSIRVDRRNIEGRSTEAVHLEFAKTSCIACIGEDIPESFLNSMGIYMATGGPKNKKRMAVTPIMETQQPNVYMIGDILSPMYLEAETHEADPASFSDVRRRGNIKSALRDGVFVAEVINQKLQGQSQIKVNLDFAEPAPEKKEKEYTEDSTAPALAVPDFNSIVPDKAESPVEKEMLEAAPRLVRMTSADVEEDEFLIQSGSQLSIGYGVVDVQLPGDHSGTHKHAMLEERSGEYILHDQGNPQGVFLRLSSKKLRKIETGALLQLGRQYLMFGQDGGNHVVAQYDRSGKLLKKHPLSEGTIIAGRDAPNITLDPEDRVLSRRHLIISIKNGEIFVKDAGSTNRTYLRVKDSISLKDDEIFRIGPNFFKINMDNQAPKDQTIYNIPAPSHTQISSAPVAEPKVDSQPPASTPEPVVSEVKEAEAPAPAVEAAPSTNGAPSVQFKGESEVHTIEPSESVLELALDNDVSIKYECQSGSCGLDPIRIISGGEHLNDVDDEGEAWTLDEICHLEAGNGNGQCRLACMTKVSGPVVVEVVKK
ncbi:MAG: FAD-dependent oxidoreductase [Rhodothermaceae bacterium]|nr:FAD-dependent oxidoreductase [Rhodothermaceae bacterium]